MYTCATWRRPIHALNHSINDVYDIRFIYEEILVSRETKNRQNVVTLPLTEVSVLEELETLLLENGSFKEGEAIPVASNNKLASNERTIGYYAENNVVVALSVRY